MPLLFPQLGSVSLSPRAQQSTRQVKHAAHPCDSVAFMQERGGWYALTRGYPLWYASSVNAQLVPGSELELMP